MKKFHEWFDEKLNEEHPQHASVMYSKFLAQIMGWKNGERPQNIAKRTYSKISSWLGGSQKTTGVGSEIYSAIADPNRIDDIINLAKEDKVYNTSTYRACYAMLRQIHDKYQTHGTEFGTTKFASYLLHNILGKCHRNMDLEYSDAEDLYHDIIGTNPSAKKALQRAYNQDIKNLSKWKEVAARPANMPHPTFKFEDEHSVYYLIETSGIISPIHLIKMLVMKSPDRTLSYPKNSDYLLEYSTEFAEAYFPERVNLARGEHASSSEEQPNQQNNDNVRTGSTVADLSNVLGNIAKQGFSDVGDVQDDSHQTGGRKSSIMRDLELLLGGPLPKGYPKPNSPIAKLKDHTTFYKMGKLIEENKLD